MPETPFPKIKPSLDPPAPPPEGDIPPYAELDVTTNFSFLRGASHPDELVYRAAELGYRAIAVTDLNSLAGAVRAHEAARAAGIPLIVGTRLTFTDAPDLLVWAPDRAAYGRMCRLLTLGRRRAEKGECALTLQDFLEHSDGLLGALSLSPVLRGEGRGEGQFDVQRSAFSVQRSHSREKKGERRTSNAQRSTSNRQSPLSPEFRGEGVRLHREPEERALSLLRDALGDRLSLAASCAYGPDDVTHLRRLHELAH